MDKKSQVVSPSDIIALLDQMNGDPSRFDALMDMWNTIFEQQKHTPKRGFDDVEAAALNSLTLIDDSNQHASIGQKIGLLLEQFHSPVFLVRENGYILAQNQSATSTYDVVIGSSLDDLPFALEQDEQIADAVRASLNPSKNLHDAVLKRAYSKTDDRSVTLSIAPSKPIVDGVGEALVFVVDARWKTKAAGLIKREFDLTDTECQLLEGFLDGQSTQDMAEMRNRSHATIRTQFHSIMTKMGARTQTELFRNALSVSQFVDKIDDIAEVLRHPHRKRVDLVRPGGRSVEVTMAGKLDGMPLVYFQDPVTYTFERHVEQAFYDAGICILSICRPGYGNTDPGPKDQSPFQTCADDIRALLSQLGHADCMLMSMHTSSAIMHTVAPMMADHITGLVQINGCAPVQYYQRAGSEIPWAKATLRASQSNPALMRFMISSGMRAWSAFGQKLFLQTQFRKYPRELTEMTRPNALRESEAALTAATRQGYDAITQDTLVIFSDFSASVSATNLPILVVHAKNDVVMPFEGIAKFVTDYKARCTFVALPDAGFDVLTTDPLEVISHISVFVDANS